MLLFAVVIALVVLSYFVQEKRDSSLMDSFRQEHLSRLDQVELRLTGAEEELDALEARITGIEDRLDELESVIGGVQAGEQDDYKALKKEQTALRDELNALRESINEQMEENGK